jgi:L-alanine-DL-glutamate epimerase-like enolase superfamily enzyme
MGIGLDVRIERFPIAGHFTISRGTRTEAVVVTAILADGAHRGRGECVPYARYGETVDGVAEAIRGLQGAFRDGSIASRAALAAALPAGAARNALDCALWDLEAKRAGRSVAELAGRPSLHPLVTCYTLSLGSPQAMHDDALKAAARPLLKVKLGGDGDAERIAAVREGAPAALLVVDANEAWRETNLPANLEACRRADVRLIEQPLPAGADDALEGLASPVPLCADESLHVAADLAALRGRYQAVNVKLDKTGGLTEALALVARAHELRLKVMLGCMVGTSLAMAPAIVAAQGADWVDLDGPLLLAEDRVPGLVYEGSTVYPPEPDLWG